MPNNQSTYKKINEFSIVDKTLHFKMSKDISNHWRLGYYEGHRDKPLKDLLVLFEVHCKTLKYGLAELILKVQSYEAEHFKAIKEGRKRLFLDNECWDDREGLGLSPIKPRKTSE